MSKKNNKRLHYHEQTLADQDYKHKLTDIDREWLLQFNKEYYQGIYNENEREIHPQQWDAELKAARSARRKDAYDNSKADIKYEAVEELETEELEEIDTLYKIDEKRALDILRTQAQDMMANKIDTVENILTDLQRDTIKIFLNARKNI